MKPTLFSLLQKSSAAMDRKWILPLSIASTISLLLLLVLTTVSSPLSPLSLLPLPLLPSFLLPSFVESKLRSSSFNPLPAPPRLAYLISGSSGDGKLLIRTLQALYHPRNSYVVHLDLESPEKERRDLQDFVQEHPIFRDAGNVRMITKANLVTYRGPTMVANTLHAAAILLRAGGDWDWFINLSASDYPLVTQDGELA